MSGWELAGRTVVITGAGGGLGSNLAQALRAKGCNLALLDLDLDRVERQAEALGGPAHARGWRADVRDLASLESAFADVHAHFGRIDVAVANAGVELIQAVATGDPTAFEALIDINLTGVWRTLRTAIPYVKAQRGYLLAVSSMAAFIHSPLQSGYTASKAGVWAMSNSMRLELRPHGVAVGTLHPTFFNTPMHEEMLQNPAGEVLWGGHRRAPFKMVPRDDVIAAGVRAIARRSKTVTVPRDNTVAAIAPGVLRGVIGRFGFSDNTIQRASELSAAYVGTKDLTV
ncbi:SDR family NAD(P)-dependent oxidoreductase [Mycolicibacterium phocaicum]|uniref:Short-chain dehydrogenase n=1 Tax=Mycolicibacterium phocaicum TaxID=319706 RepID=A0A7I7ZWI8_9MYCO|nr:SDR family NAD(P)-dependent oxidoreductase [Mycolicibacterium phocaicum]TLH64046.1 short-chain dehydrogenase [Mycolicibacterium phocaicum]BBZ58089.1 short-chain dehydrogenase [Mycolicibacterium phocaicum]